MGYEHETVSHAEKVYVKGNAHTNTIEGFWSQSKNGIRGVYHAVSAKYLQNYLDEYTHSATITVTMSLRCFFLSFRG